MISGRLVIEASAEMNEGRKPEGLICVCETQTNNRLSVCRNRTQPHTRWKGGRVVECGRLVIEASAEMNEGRQPEGLICVCGTQTNNRLSVCRNRTRTHTRWKGGRVVECGRLEICCTACLYRGFESLPFRH